MNEEKIEHIFGGGTLFEVLQKIDALPTEIATEIRGIVYANGRYGTMIEKRKNKNIEQLIELGYLEDITSASEILEQKYSKDNLFKELSKKMYDFQPKSSTTKKAMVEYILTNEKAMNNLVYKKWITAIYTEEFKKWSRELYEFLDKLIIKHPYMTTEVKLVDFYYELNEDKAKEEENFNAMINGITDNNPKKTDEKTSWFSKLFKKK